MRGHTYNTRIIDRDKWHPWFAWRPVRCFTDETGDSMCWAWLEIVDRVSYWGSHWKLAREKLPARRNWIYQVRL